MGLWTMNFLTFSLVSSCWRFHSIWEVKLSPAEPSNISYYDNIFHTYNDFKSVVFSACKQRIFFLSNTQTEDFNPKPKCTTSCGKS